MTEDKRKTLEFIEEYRKCQVLWDPHHRYYSNKTKRNSALIAISKKHNFDIRSVKNKIKSLRSYFAKEHRKVLTLDNYQSTWFAYKAISFIWNSITPNETAESKVNTLEDIALFDCASLQDKSPESQAAYISEVDHEFVQPIHAKSIKINGVDGEEDYNTVTRENIDNRDESDVFGQLIAHKLRKLNPRNKLLAERRINNIFYDLELGELDSATSNPLDNSVHSVAPVKLSPASVHSGYTSNDD